MNRRNLFRSILAAAAVPRARQMLGSQLKQANSRQPESRGEGGRACYTTEWRRTRPDYVLYLPPEPLGNDGDNEHLHVVATPKGDLLATWSQGSYESSRDSRTVS